MQKVVRRPGVKSENPFFNKSRDTSKQIAYPWRLQAEDVLRILLAFPVKKFWGADLSELNEGAPDMSRFYIDVFKSAGLLERVGLSEPSSEYEMRHLNYVARGKILYLFNLLKTHPSLLTREMTSAINGSEVLQHIIGGKTINLIPIKNKTGVVKSNIILIGNTNELSPLAREEAVKQDIRERIIDLSQIILHSVTEKEIQKSPLSVKLKGLENLMKAYLMFDKNSAPQALLQVNIKNMTLQQKKELSTKTAQLM